MRTNGLWYSRKSTRSWNPLKLSPKVKGEVRFK